MTIDWEGQWQEFAEDFHHGYAHIRLQKYGGKKDSLLRLAPGPGFGDLSHPTTALMLEMMADCTEGKEVLDIGCGSGILTLAAPLFGALYARGVDISLEAVEHAQKNAEINGLTDKAAFFSETPFPLVAPSSLILMNMILSEQRVVMREKERLNAKGSFWITSGILEEQKEAYLAECAAWGWKIEEIRQKKGWLGCIYRK